MRDSIVRAELITLGIVLLSLGLAFVGNQSVFRLVLLAAPFVPLILMMTLGAPFDSRPPWQRS